MNTKPGMDNRATRAHGGSSTGESEIIAAPQSALATDVIWRSALVLFMVVPWINPFAGGPSPSVSPWLVSMVCAILACLVPRPIDAALMARAVLLAALASAVMAIAQYIGIADRWAPWVNAPAIGEAYANLRQRNQFASLTSLGLIALLHLAGERPFARHVWWMAALLAVSAACSASRTGLVQWMLIWLFVAWLERAFLRRRAGLAAFGLIAYGAAAVAMPLLLQAGAGIEAGSVLTRLAHETVDCASRLTLWSNVLYLIAQRPWIGWGWGELDYAHFITLYPGERFCDILDNAHNLPLHLAVELGVPVAALVCMLAALLVVLGRPWKEGDAARQMAWLWLLVIGVHSMLEYPLWYGPFQITMIWCLVRLARRPQEAGMLAAHGWPGWPRPIARGLRNLGHALALLALIALGYAAWDYHRISQIYLPVAQRAESYRTETLSKIRDSVLFHSQVQFAELATVPLSRANSARMHELSLALLHFSPEARVAERLIESAIMLNRLDEARFYLERYRRAFPRDHARWAADLAARSSTAPRADTR